MTKTEMIDILRGKKLLKAPENDNELLEGLKMLDTIFDEIADELEQSKRVVHAHWIEHDDEWGLTTECSYCHVEGMLDGDFCCRCGAQMDELSAPDRFPPIDAKPIRHAHWTDDHKCSACGGEAFSETVNIRPEYDYDWDENLVFTGSYEYDIEYHETDWCPFCGAQMDEVLQ